MPDERSTSRIALTSDGAIGAWLLSGPCTDLARAQSRLQPGFQSPCAEAKWRSITSSAGEFDWADILHVPANAPATAIAGAWLHLEKPFDGWLLVAADGELRVSVDGTWQHHRAKPRQRGRAFVPIPLLLAAGWHPIGLWFVRHGNRSTFSAILRDRQTNESPSDARLYLPGGPPERRLTEQLLTLSIRLPLGRSPPELELELAFPSGAPPLALPVAIDLQQNGTTKTQHWSPGMFSGVEPHRARFVVHLGPLDAMAAAGLSTLTVRLGEASVVRKIWLTPSVVAGLERASHTQTLDLVRRSATSRYDDYGSTLEARWDDVATKMLEPSSLALDLAVERLTQFANQLDDARRPFLVPGVVDAYIRSAYDGRPESTLVRVPDGFAASDARTWPLIVLLHGYNSTPQRILEAFLPSKSEESAKKVDAFVLAPAAHGNTFYRGPGERAVIDALDWATSVYPIDSTRISITGVSMGGTGTAEIAFHNSERFAAAAPLCGYQSYFVRRDTANKPLRSWERPLMHRLSAASLAEAGNDIPLYVAHGTKDLPLENSRVLTTRYRALGYNLTEDWPDLGHSVWKKTYAHAAMVTWLTRWQKDQDPARVVVASSSLASGRKFWIELTELANDESPSTIDARVVAPNELEIKSRGVVAFGIGETRHLAPNATFRVNIDGSSLIVAPGGHRHFVNIDGRWRVSELPVTTPRKTGQVEGPWSELYSAPLAVVYGTGTSKSAALNREIAIRLVEPRFGVSLRIPVIADRDFSPESSPLTRLIYVGRPDDHRHLAKIQDALPIRITATAIELGSTRFAEPDVGVAFVYPDPTRRDRLLGVVSANGPEGLWRVLALPALLPDFVVFDRGTDAAAGEPILGPDAWLRAAGFFRADWSLPENPLDPLAPELH